MSKLKVKPLEREWTSVDDAEVVSGLSKWTWRRKAYKGDVASTKVGRRLLIPLSEIRRVMAEGMRPRLVADDRDRDPEIVAGP